MQDQREMIGKLVRTEVIYNVYRLIERLLKNENYYEELSGLIGQEDKEGNMPEVLEYWLVTPWLAERLEAHGELVTSFCDLDVWGRQTSGQSIELDTVIEDIAIKHLQLVEDIAKKEISHP